MSRGERRRLAAAKRQKKAEAEAASRAASANRSPNCYKKLKAWLPKWGQRCLNYLEDHRQPPWVLLIIITPLLLFISFAVPYLWRNRAKNIPSRASNVVILGQNQTEENFEKTGLTKTQLHVKLEATFPFGYVLFRLGYPEMSYTPKPSIEMRWEADWRQTEIQPNFAEGTVIWTTPSIDGV